jgi:hypothetical protein
MLVTGKDCETDSCQNVCVCVLQIHSGDVHEKECCKKGGKSARMIV